MRPTRNSNFRRLGLLTQRLVAVTDGQAERYGGLLFTLGRFQKWFVFGGYRLPRRAVVFAQIFEGLFQTGL